MKIGFRVDASLEIGSGHVMRCLTLADALSKNGAECFFLSKEWHGHMLAYISERGYRVHALPTDIGNPDPEKIWKDHDQRIDTQQCMRAMDTDPIDWMILDHYGLDARWEESMRSRYLNLLVIDDLANRPHSCTILLDQTLGKNRISDYASLLPEDCTLLAGPAHVLLRPEFDRSSLRERTGIIENVMVYFGGNDRTNQAGKVIASLQSFPHLNVEVILGMNHPFKEFAHLAVRNNPRFRIFERCDDIARSMLNADLGIGVCGMAAWERCALGLPALVTISAENQKEDACALNDLGAVLLLGRSENIDHLQWTEALELVLNNPLRVKKMSEAATAVVAGHAENRLKLIQRMIGYAS